MEDIYDYDQDILNKKKKNKKIQLINIIKNLACEILTPSAVALATYFLTRECASTAERFCIIGNSEEFPIMIGVSKVYSNKYFCKNAQKRI